MDVYRLAIISDPQDATAEPLTIYGFPAGCDTPAPPQTSHVLPNCYDRHVARTLTLTVLDGPGGTVLETHTLAYHRTAGGLDEWPLVGGPYSVVFTAQLQCLGGISLAISGDTFSGNLTAAAVTGDFRMEGWVPDPSGRYVVVTGPPSPCVEDYAQTDACAKPVSRRLWVALTGGLADAGTIALNYTPDTGSGPGWVWAGGPLGACNVTAVNLEMFGGGCQLVVQRTGGFTSTGYKAADNCTTAFAWAAVAGDGLHDCSAVAVGASVTGPVLPAVNFECGGGGSGSGSGSGAHFRYALAIPAGDTAADSLPIFGIADCVRDTAAESDPDGLPADPDSPMDETAGGTTDRALYRLLVRVPGAAADGLPIFGGELDPCCDGGPRILIPWVCDPPVCPAGIPSRLSLTLVWNINPATATGPLATTTIPIEFDPASLPTAFLCWQGFAATECGTPLYVRASPNCDGTWGIYFWAADPGNCTPPGPGAAFATGSAFITSCTPHYAASFAAGIYTSNAGWGCSDAFGFAAFYITE